MFRLHIDVVVVFAGVFITHKDWHGRQFHPVVTDIDRVVKGHLRLPCILPIAHPHIFCRVNIAKPPNNGPKWIPGRIYERRRLETDKSRLTSMKEYRRYPLHDLGILSAFLQVVISIFNPRWVPVLVSRIDNRPHLAVTGQDIAEP